MPSSDSDLLYNKDWSKKHGKPKAQKTFNENLACAHAFNHSNKLIEIFNQYELIFIIQ